MSANVDLTELRHNASELVRRAQAGEEFTITVAGQPSARLMPVELSHWRRWGEIADLFSGPTEAPGVLTWPLLGAGRLSPLRCFA